LRLANRLHQLACERHSLEYWYLRYLCAHAGRTQKLAASGRLCVIEVCGSLFIFITLERAQILIARLQHAKH